MPQKSTNPISDVASTLKNVTLSPAGAMALTGLGVYGIGRLGWSPVVNTIRTVARVPGKALGGLSDAEWDMAMDELERDSDYRKYLPAVFGVLAAGGLGETMRRPNEKYYGLFKWNAKPSADFSRKDYIAAGTKTASFQDSSSYVDNGIDFNRIINARQAANLFTGDPLLSDYAQNMGAAIVNNAALHDHSRDTTLGSVFDSAFDKFNKKLSFSGLAQTGVRTVVANGMARLFTSALDSVSGLSPVAQRNIIDTGTWAGAITAILE